MQPREINNILTEGKNIKEFYNTACVASICILVREEEARQGEARRGEETQAVLTEAAGNVYSSHADLDSEPFTASINLITEGRSFSSLRQVPVHAPAAADPPL